MIPWQDTAEPRIQVRKHYGVIPVAPGQHIVGWEVRVWWPLVLSADSCRTCGRKPGLRNLSAKTASKRPDAANLWHNDEWAWAPYAHECSSPVPWAARSSWPSEGWQQPHHHPTKWEALEEVYDERATPVLYSSAQLAYCAGLELLGIEPRHHHWKPPEPFPHPRCLNLRSA